MCAYLICYMLVLLVSAQIKPIYTSILTFLCVLDLQ